MKKILVITAFILVLPGILPASAALQDVFRDIYSLTSSGVIPGKPAETGLSRADAVKLILEGVKNVTTGGYEASTDDVEKLYRLVKMFVTDIVETGVLLSDVEEMLVSLRMISEKERLRKIEEKLNELENARGLKIRGEASVSILDLHLSGNKYAEARAYRPMTEYVDLIFYVYQSARLSAEAVFRIQSLFGSYWSAMNIYGVRKISIWGKYPVSFELGAYSAKLTPYTLWAVDDERPFEAAFFRDKRETVKREVYLSGEEWPLTGMKLYSDFTLFDGANFDLTVLAARIASANNTSATSFNSYINAPYYTGAGATFVIPHDRYMAGARLETDLSLKDSLLFGMTYVDIRDIKESGLVKVSPSMSNYTGSADISFKPVDALRIKGEFAMSNYYVAATQSAQAWMNKDNIDTAFSAGIEADAAGLKFDAEFISNGSLFTSFAAQSRTYDGYANYPYITENNTFNIATQPPSYSLGGVVFPLTMYSAAINASYNRPGKTLMPYVFYENNALPYGKASPNRQGALLNISGEYFESALKPALNAAYLVETESFHPGSESAYPRAFLVAGAGVSGKIGGVSGSAGYKFEMTENTAVGGNVNLSSNIIDAGLGYDFTPKISLKAGFRGIIYRGKEAPYTYLSGAGWVYGDVTDYDASIMKWGIGVNYKIFKFADARLSYASSYITDRLDSANNFTAQEINFGTVMKF